MERFKVEPKVEDKGPPTLRQQHSILSYQDLVKRCEEIGAGRYVINELIPQRSLGLLVGHSGLGKSALVYQMALCVASGKDFIGHKVAKGRVLVIDYENGIGQVKDMLGSLSNFLKLESVPDELGLFNYNDIDSSSSQMVREAIIDFKPSLVIVDSITGMYPEIEEKNSNALRAYQDFRQMIKATGTSILGIHHLKKPSTDKYSSSPSLEDEGTREWFYQVRGASALINNSDVRLGVDEPKQRITYTNAITTIEIALVMRGFGRVKGEIPLMHIVRVSDDEGEPLGYEKAAGEMLLSNPEQMDAYKNLPNTFRFKDAQQKYGKGAQSTDNFLKKCIAIGILKRINKGYEKVTS
jgi:hypothetical protein